jgi:hypothetical protein
VGRNDRALSGLFALGLLSSACARSADRQAAEPSHAPVSLGIQGVAPGAPAVPFREKTAEQRMEFMGLVFHPRMNELFARHGYDHFRCQTCHGEDMEARGFKMPATLRALGPDPVSAGRERDAKATGFMVAEVTPLAVELLGGGPAEGNAALECFTCHAREGSGAGSD